MEDEYNIDNLPLFANGVWNGKKTDRKRIDSFIEAYKTLSSKGMKPSGKITHIQSKKQRDKETIGIKSVPFAFGQLENLRLEETGKIHPVLKEPIVKLFGDLKGVGEKVKGWWDKGQLKGVSLEINPEMRLQDKTLVKNAISSVALLGHETPALFEAENYQQSGSEGVESSEQVEIYSMYSQGEISMNKEKYMERVRKFEEKGLKPKSFEKYAELEKEEQEKYMSGMEEKMSGNVEENYSQKPSNKVEEIDTIIAGLKDQLSETKGNREEFYSIAKELSSELIDENKGIREENKNILEELEQIKTERKREKVEREVYALTRTDAPKLPPALESAVVDLFMSASEDAKEMYSANGVAEKSMFDSLSSVFNALPANQSLIAKVTVPNERGFSTDTVEGSNEEYEQIEAYALKQHNVADLSVCSYEKSVEITNEYRNLK